jgi:hypothetical protein
MLAAADAGIVEGVRLGMAGSPQISDTQLLQFQLLARALFYHLEDSFHQHKDGQLPDPVFRTFEATTKVNMRSPGLRAAWRRTRNGFEHDFVEFVDRIVADTPVNTSPMTLAAWQADIAAEMSTG